MLLLLGCEDWPLYLNLPEEDFSPPAPVLVEVSEDPAQPEGSPQSLGSPDLPARIVLSGSSDPCGYDTEAPGPDWPVHAYDGDGDGIADGKAPSSQGWFSGDVDWFSIEASADLWFRTALSWSEAPASGLNAPWDPLDTADPTESDVDVLLVSPSGDLNIVDDRGASRESPETVPDLPLPEGEAIGVLVACHHGLATAWTLEIELSLP